MNKDGMYYKVTQEYLQLNAQKRRLTQERDKINAQLKLIEDFLVDLNDILCKHGNHVYEHFEESEERHVEEYDLVNLGNGVFEKRYKAEREDEG